MRPPRYHCYFSTTLEINHWGPFFGNDSLNIWLKNWTVCWTQINVNLYNIGNWPLAKAANWTSNFSSLAYSACTVKNFSTGADKVLTEQKSDKSFQQLPLQSLCKPPSGIELFRTDSFFMTFWQDFPKRYDNIFWLKQRSKCSPSYSPIEGLYVLQFEIPDKCNWPF